MTQTLPESYAACQEVVRASGSNFAMAFWLLPREKRLAMHALYAFARHTDDLGDSDLPTTDKAQALAAWRQAFQAALTGEARGKLLPAVADSIDKFGIPPTLFEEIIDGVERDLVQTRYATWEELRGYCYSVAGAVGLACLHIWGFQGQRPTQLATACGEAFQLTNILRDLQEDAARDRVYLPAEDFQACGYTIEDLQRNAATFAFDRLMERELVRAEVLYREAGDLHGVLSRDGQRVFRLMFGRYRAILQKIKRHPRRVLAGRLRLNLPHKLWIAGRELVAPTLSTTSRVHVP
jgi:phytoene synthase